MQTTSSVYQSILQEENHHFEVKLNIAGSDYGQDVIFSMKSDSRLFESAPTIGGTYSGTLEFSLLGDGADIPRMAVVKPYYRAVGASQTSEWLQKGEYYIDTRSVSQNEGGVVVFNAFCYDSMLKANAPYASSNLSWPATPKQVVNEIAGKMGVTITSYASTVLNSSYVSIPMPVQYNMREVLGFIAAAYGGNWFINYEGQLDFKELYMMGLGSAQLAVGTNVSNLNVSPNRGAYTKVILDVDDETAYESGSDETNVLEATCPYATQAVADRILSELTQYSFLYKPFEAIGCWTNPAVELTDSVTFTDTSVLRPVCARTINFGPAMVMDLTAPNDNDIDHEYAFESPTERNYKRTTARVINQLNVNEDGISLVSEKLNNIGGRNILLNSATVHWEAINSATVSYTDGVSVAEWGCNDAIRATGTGGQTAIMLQLLYTSQTAATLLADRKYVMSCWIKNNSAGTIWLAANGGTSDEIAPGEEKRAVVYVEGDGSTALRMRLGYDTLNSAFDFVYWHPQIEYGEVVTSWSPAPEDKVGNDEIISKINVSPENIVISANKVDLQGYVTFTNLSTSGETTINGGNITTGLIQDQAGKNAWNLSTGALTITEGSINISTNSGDVDKIILNYTNAIGTQYQTSIKPYGLSVSAAGGGVTASGYNVSYLGFRGSDGTSSSDGSHYGLCALSDSRLSLAADGSVSRIWIETTGELNTHMVMVSKESSANRVDFETSYLRFGTNATALSLGTERMRLDQTFLRFSDSNGVVTSQMTGGGSLYLGGTSSTGTISIRGSSHTLHTYVTPSLYQITKQDNSYSVLIWPDSANNGAGRLVLGDGTSTKWRTSLTNDGLTFRNSSDAVTASYPATGPMTWDIDRTLTAGEIALYHCTGTVGSINAVIKVDTANKIMFISGRIRITNFARTSNNPGVQITPTGGIGPFRISTAPCGYYSNGATVVGSETLVMTGSNTSSFVVATTETHVNAPSSSSSVFYMIMPIMVKYG